MLISVIIPCYNVAPYIERCLESVIQQTYTNYELIIVDNNCSDDTMEKVGTYLKKHNQKAILLSEERQGSSSARNKGLNAAKGEWIQFLDADDALLPEKIAHQVGLLKESDASLIWGATYEVELDGSKHILKPGKDKVLSLLKGYRSGGSTCSNLWQREALLNVGGFDTQLQSSEEVDLMCKLYQKNVQIIIDEVPLTLIYRRHNESNISSGAPPLLAKNWLKVREEFIKHLLNKSLFQIRGKEKLWLLERTLYNLETQALIDPHTSHRQYHEVFWPPLKSQFLHLSFRRILKNICYQLLGFKRTRLIISALKSKT